MLNSLFVYNTQSILDDAVVPTRIRGDNKYTNKSGRATIEECYDLVKFRLLEVTIQNGRSNNRGQGKQDELDWYDDLYCIIK